jgi:hypothetical protein
MAKPRQPFSEFENGTWLESEKFCSPRGGGAEGRRKMLVAFNRFAFEMDAQDVSALAGKGVNSQVIDELLLKYRHVFDGMEHKDIEEELAQTGAGVWSRRELAFAARGENYRRLLFLVGAGKADVR